MLIIMFTKKFLSGNSLPVMQNFSVGAINNPKTFFPYPDAKFNIFWCVKNTLIKESYLFKKRCFHQPTCRQQISYRLRSVFLNASTLLLEISIG